MNKVKHSAEFNINQPANILFPLFSAEGEKLWVPGWDYENLMGSTNLSEDYIFLTKTHDHASTDAIWIVKKYDPSNFFVQFYKIEPEDKIGIISVKCTEYEQVKTNVNVTYEYIGLGKTGNEFIKNFTEENYKDFIEEWETLLNKYFNDKIN